MKKMISLILIGFILTSLLSVSFMSNSTSRSLNLSNYNEKDSEVNNGYTTNLSTQSSKANIFWNKSFGGEYVDVAQSVTKSNFGGFVISGWTNSSGAGDLDIWIVRISDEGAHIWNKTFGDFEEDKGFEIIECINGGFAIAATFTNTSTFVSNSDFSVIKIADNGNVIWHNNYSGPEQTDLSLIADLGRSIVECPNGDLVLAGVTATAAGYSDVWLFCIDQYGIKKWDRTYNHWYTERCYTPHSLVRCSDGGFAIACYTYNATLSNDVWLIRTNQFGIPLWNKTYGDSSGYERPESLVQCQDGGFGIIANTQSFGAGGTDAWFIRTDAFGNQLWNKTYGGIEEDCGNQVLLMLNNGFCFAGTTHSFDLGNGDGWIIRIDSEGNILWNHTLGDECGNAFSSFLYIGNNTFVAVGTTYQLGMLYPDLWVNKFQIYSESTEEPVILGFPLLDVIFAFYFGLVYLVINYSRKRNS